MNGIWLKTVEGERIRYRTGFPYFEEVRHQNTNYSLLLDSSNVIWGLKTTDGKVQAQGYFEEQHIEAKSVGKVCGTFLTVVGGVMLWAYTYVRRCGDKMTIEEKVEAETHLAKPRLLVYLLGYLMVYGFVIGPWLLKFFPRFVVGLLWIVSAAVLVSVLKRKYPQRLQ